MALKQFRFIPVKKLHLRLRFSLLALGCSATAAAALLELQPTPGKEWRLSDLGTLDWVVFGAEAGRATLARARTGGTGIARALTIEGTVAFDPDRFSAWEFDWPAGVAGDDGIGNTANAAPTTRFALNPGTSVTLHFEGAAAGEKRLAAVWVRPQKPLAVTVVQGAETKTVTLARAGWLRVTYDGAEPLQIRLLGGAAPIVVQNLAAVLSLPVKWWLRDERFVLAYAATPQAELLRRSHARPAPDFLGLARAFADAMLRHGRDRHGPQASPLFSRSLTREAEPQLTPYPLYADHSPQDKETLARLYASRRLTGFAVNPYNRFNYDRVQNYPKGLGAEGPHKTTVYGADPFEDRALYTLLFELGTVTRDARYAAAAAESLTWWYRHTQRPGGLYPWGEHAGWDLVHECPTYYAGPSQGFFEANYHEVRDFLLYPEQLAALPPPERFALTPLERYAVGIWQHHFWDKQKAWFNRHADIDGVVNQIGDGLGFPAHLGYYLRLWAAALEQTKNPSVRTELTVAFHRTLNMAISRTEKHGFFPFSFEVEMRGAPPGTEASTQSIRLAHHAFAIGDQLETVAPDLAAKLRRLAQLHLKEQPDDVTRRNLRLAAASGNVGFIAGKKMTPPERVAALRDFSGDAVSDGIAQEIADCVVFYNETKRPEYLRAATEYARIARELFCDEHSPLPRALRQEVSLRTTRGEAFPDFYFDGARLMRAFALLGSATGP